MKKIVIAFCIACAAMFGTSASAQPVANAYWNVGDLFAPEVQIVGLELDIGIGRNPGLIPAYGAIDLADGSSVPVDGSGFITTQDTLIVSLFVEQRNIFIELDLTSGNGYIELYEINGAFIDDGALTLVDIL